MRHLRSAMPSMPMISRSTRRSWPWRWGAGSIKLTS